MQTAVVEVWRSVFFLVIMWWLFLVDVAVVGGVFGGLNFVLFFFFFLCGDYFLWLWLVVDLVILVVGFLVDVVC